MELSHVIWITTLPVLSMYPTLFSRRTLASPSENSSALVHCGAMTTSPLALMNPYFPSISAGNSRTSCSPCELAGGGVAGAPAFAGIRRHVKIDRIAGIRFILQYAPNVTIPGSLGLSSLSPDKRISPGTSMSGQRPPNAGNRAPSGLYSHAGTSRVSLSPAPGQQAFRRRACRLGDLRSR